MKIATLFSGGGILDCAFKDLGISVDLAVEGDPERWELSQAIADNYVRNYPETTLLRSPVEDVDFSDYSEDKWGIVHASPSCKNLSEANMLKGESKQDLTAARGIVRALENMRPCYFTLEQVPGYMKSQSWEIIYNALRTMHYTCSFGVVNANYYGVPQERMRLILIAYRGIIPVGLPTMQRPISWGEVLGDRLDTGGNRLTQLKCSEATPKQRAIIKEAQSLYPGTTMLIQRRGFYQAPRPRQYWEPAPVITAAIFTDHKKANRQSFFDIYRNSFFYGLEIQDMAKLQTIPDWYIFPKETAIAGAIIGNGVPCKMYEAVLRQILSHSKAINGYLDNVRKLSRVDN
jgi:DNA (cytosine-5)-methyltransferase 1